MPSGDGTGPYGGGGPKSGRRKGGCKWKQSAQVRVSKGGSSLLGLWETGRP